MASQKKKNPKTVIGLVALGVLLVVLGILTANLVPQVKEAARVASLTPTPVPAYPASVMQVTPDPAAPTAEPVLRTGSTGDEVKNLQSRLKVLGYYTGEIDGAYGSGTKEAVLAFQRTNGLDADGITGSETRQLLFSTAAKPCQATAE